MPVVEELFEDKKVVIVRYGGNDLIFHLATKDNNPYQNVLCIRQAERVLNQDDLNAIKSSVDELNKYELKVAFEFTRPEQITELVTLLMYVQKDVYEYEKWIENPC
jgi:hypothetical protein